MNASTSAEPCLVRSAKEILLRAFFFGYFLISLKLTVLERIQRRTGELALSRPRPSRFRECSFVSGCRVFLNGKIHNEYRKGLNCLFTRKAMA